MFGWPCRSVKLPDRLRPAANRQQSANYQQRSMSSFEQLHQVDKFRLSRKRDCRWYATPTRGQRPYQRASVGAFCHRCPRDFIRPSLTWRSVTTPLESNRAGHYSAVGPPPLFQRLTGTRARIISSPRHNQIRVGGLILRTNDAMPMCLPTPVDEKHSERCRRAKRRSDCGMLKQVFRPSPARPRPSTRRSTGAMRWA